MVVDDQPANLQLMEEGGGMDYITKPFQFEEVRARIETHLRMHHLRRMMRTDNEQLEEAVLCRTRELEESRLEILRRLVMAAEYREDRNTGFRPAEERKAHSPRFRSDQDACAHWQQDPLW